MTTSYHEGEVSTPENSAGDSAGATERAQEAAGTAAEQGQHVAGVAQDHAKKVTSEARDKARGLLDEATAQIDGQSRTQKGKLAETLRGFGEDLERMSNGEGADSADGADGATGAAQQLVQQAAHRANDLAGRLESREPQELLDDLRRFARDKPGAFVLGALVAGVAVGRLTRGAKAAKDEDEGSESGRTDVVATRESALPGVAAGDGLDAASATVPGTSPRPATGGQR